MKITLERHEKMLLELLRLSLTDFKLELSIFKAATEKNWKNCYLLAREHGVLSLAWDGILKLDPSLYPPRNLKLSWAIAVDKQEKRYMLYVHTANELRNIFAKNGIRTVQLKGTGLSSYYPVPSHREGGDIDIYTYSADLDQITDNEAAKLSDKLIEDLGIKVDRFNAKHSSFYFHGIPVENHKHFLETDAMKSAVSLDQYLKSILNPENVTLLEGKYNVLVPSVEFNTLFLAFHALQHYGNGLCLHHFCDWACLIQRNGLKIPVEIQDVHLINLINTLTAFTNRFLGTKVNVEYSEELLNKFIIETLRPPYTMHYAGMNKIQQFIYKSKRFWHYLRLRQEVTGDSMATGVKHSVIAHLKNPKAIFDKGH